MTGRVVHRVGPETERLVLRAFESGDAEAFFALNTHPDVMRYTDDRTPPSVETAREAIETYTDFERHGFGRWACIYKPERRIIGLAGLKRLEDLGEVDLGYRFLPDYWGRGLATEVSRASLAFGFDTLRLERIIGLVLKQNRASIRVLEKVGMSFEQAIDYQGVRVLRYATGPADRLHDQTGGVRSTLSRRRHL